MRGQRRCYMHGGKTPVALAAAKRRLVNEEVERALGELDYGPVTDPWSVLEDVAGRVKVIGDWLLGRTVAAGLEPSEAAPVLQMAYLDKSGEWIDRLARLSEALAKLGIDERRVRVSEVQTVLLGKALDRAMAREGLTGGRADGLRKALGRELRALTAGGE